MTDTREYVRNLERWLAVTLLCALAAFFMAICVGLILDKRIEVLEEAQTEVLP